MLLFVFLFLSFFFFLFLFLFKVVGMVLLPTANTSALFEARNKLVIFKFSVPFAFPRHTVFPSRTTVLAELIFDSWGNLISNSLNVQRITSNTQLYAYFSVCL